MEDNKIDRLKELLKSGCSIFWSNKRIGGIGFNESEKSWVAYFASDSTYMLLWNVDEREFSVYVELPNWFV